MYREFPCKKRSADETNENFRHVMHIMYAYVFITFELERDELARKKNR